MKAIGIVLSVLAYLLFCAPSMYITDVLFETHDGIIDFTCATLLFVQTVLFGSYVSVKFYNWFNSHIK